MKLKHFPHEDPLVIEANVAKGGIFPGGNDIERILVDNGSSADIIFWHCFLAMGLTEKHLEESDKPLFGFGNKKVTVKGKFSTNITFGEGDAART